MNKLAYKQFSRRHRQSVKEGKLKFARPAISLRLFLINDEVKLIWQARIDRVQRLVFLLRSLLVTLRKISDTEIEMRTDVIRLEFNRLRVARDRFFPFSKLAVGVS